MKRLDERFLFTPTTTTEINESNAKDLLPNTVFDYVKLSNGKTLLKVEGIVGDYVNPNGNNRIYEEAVWDNVLNNNNHIIKDINEHNAWGVREHPDTGETVLPEISHRILSMRKDESTRKIIAEILIVDTAAGKDIRAMLESGGTVGMSTRGMGDTYMKEGVDYVQVGYICETIDFVTVNSVHDARFNLSVNASPVEKASDIVSESKKSDKEPEQLQDETVNSNSDDSIIHESKMLSEKKMVNLQSKRLELASLRVIAESNMDDSQMEAIVEATQASVDEIKGSIKAGEISESEASEVLSSYAKVVETAKQNTPMARELAESKQELKTLSEKYATLKQLAEGLQQRHVALQENYKELSADSKVSDEAGVEGSEEGVSPESTEPQVTVSEVSEADVKASKRYQTLLSLAEGLVIRAKRTHKVAESAKTKVVASRKALALAEAKLKALKESKLSDKASALLMKCESVEQVSKVVERVSQINESKKKEATKKPASKPMVESQAHKEPLPGSADVSAESKKPELHESLSVVQRLRKMK